MSSGMGHMCIAMGIAEAIAISTMVTAKSFAISPAFGLRPSGRVWNRRRIDCGDWLAYIILLYRIYLLKLWNMIFSSYFALKVKFAEPAPPAATVTFCVWVP